MKKQQQPTNQKARRRFTGVVVSDKMQKTIVVRIERAKTHPKYQKQFAASKRYKVHDEKNEFKAGDVVTFEECRPYSKDKRWRVIGKA
jgi:small subunit ribosomal protein S17